jgi:hypothetical protein
LLSTGIPALAQNLEKTKQRIEVLASPKFHGRGYVKNGVNIAADYIVDELKETKVKYFGNSYHQPFFVNVNTFPSKLELKIDDKLLNLGTDYIIGHASSDFKGKYDLLIVDTLLLNNTDEFINSIKDKDTSKKILVIDHKFIHEDKSKKFFIHLIYSNFLNFAGIIELIPNELLTSVGTYKQKYPLIKIKREAFPCNSNEVFINIKSKFIKNFKTKNIIGYVEGAKKDEYVVFSAHYDHVGMMGKKVYVPGAQDNASGTALLLDLADYYSKNNPEYSIVFMFFGGEELGLLGSNHYIKNPLFDLSKIKLLINLDMVGTGDDGITIVNAENEEYKDIWKVFERINNENYFLSEMKPRGISNNSDHAPFYEKNIPAIFIYTMGGNTFYHNMKDTPETLTFAGYNGLFKLLTKFVSEYE